MSANTPPPSKQQRHDKHDLEREGERSSLLSRLELIPLEILAEVLSYVNSPNDVLSVARCSKHLCATLLNPSNVIIWRRARSHCVVPDLPPPPPGWRESAYAAFVFDEGQCLVCDGVTRRMFWSFVARVRICGQQECLRKLLENHVVKQPHPYISSSDLVSRFFQERLKYLEVPVLGLLGSAHRYCLRTDVDKTLYEYDEASNEFVSLDEYLPWYLQRHETDFFQREHVLKHAKILHSWSQRWYHKYRTTKASNTDFARNLAAEAGWNLEDLLNTSTFSSLYRSHNACLETISDGDVRLLVPDLDGEIFSRAENKERRQKAHAHQMRHADIARHYNRLVEGKNYPVVPNLAEFRGLPIIKALQDRDDAIPFLSRPSSAKTPRVLESELKRSELIGGMIDSDIKKWVNTALVAFDSILGQPKWKTASTRVLHPAERATARFICTLCSSPSSKTCDTTESLSFREACAHECARYSGNAAAKRKWRADQFVPDKKAIKVLSLALSLLSLKAESRETESEIEQDGLNGLKFVCKSCDSPVVMSFQRLAGHCRRHDEMQVEATFTDNSLAKYPYDAGSIAKYTARTDKAKKMRQMKEFGCRHCQYRRPEPAVPRPARKGGDPSQKRFTFDGLISHAKEKHKIFLLGDEDFFRDSTVDGGKKHT